MRICPHRIGEQVDFTTADNPNVIWPQTTWTAVEGSFPLASSSSHSLGSTGGAETVTLTTDQIPSHNHTQNPHGHDYYFDRDANVNWYLGLVGGSVDSNKSAIASGPQGRSYTMNIRANTATNNPTGGGGSHNNMPPFVTVNRWKRVA